MNFFNSFDISGYGLSSQRLRANLISANIANANTTRTDEGGPYRRQMVSFRAFDFNKMLNNKLAKNSNGIGYEDPLNEGDIGKIPKPAIMGVYVDKIVRDDREPLMKYEPGHPDANSEGYVAYPNVNPVIEMADLIEATRAYQANVAAFQSAKTMAGNAILMMQA
ncbi:flagellar basal body rod protein FlgC [Helicobacter sp. CLO-3]|uniref:flagellar basal body rod protein FlgC n=1 Tax=unclassified Helicobacter TaxID=2593540 RepID=UPI000805A207|nr:MULTISPECIES: flagellar basal body rod protein FlgC [unclassified Helicobacter]OBV29641.1 flagellar basal body rod protein FlgC [Helicobacter sp. CLO-3]OHU85611.1 flagellar basal body rod protein FlgC [Helicobacter sp. CLO-3]